MDRQTLPDMSRRRLLALLGGTVGAVAGGSYLLSDDTEPTAEPVEDKDQSRHLAETYAPTLYFGKRERWFPTDPRPYTSEEDGETVVTGFDALDGYTAAMRETGSPPDPATFYQVLQYPNSSLVCIQYWFYSAFDQFTTNFHWHDWEVLHVFVDLSVSSAGTTENANSTETATANDPASTTSTATDAPPTGTSVLFVASAHSRKVPNNEYLDPPQDRAAIISEVGSHSSTLGVNAEPTTFQRTSLGELAADISNNPVEIISGQSSLPLAYGLPRDEGLNLPFAIPELDGEPLPDHEKLPNLRHEDLLPDDITFQSYEDLARPPESIPKREGAYSFVPESRADEKGDVNYKLHHIDEVRHIDGFTGPTLSFSFRVPQFAEDAFSSHLSTPGVPWVQERFTAPTADISDPQHRAALADRYEAINEGGQLSRILGAVREAADTDEAPGSNGVALLAPNVETVALLESEPEAAPSFGGVIVMEDPPEGEHRFTVNGAGMAPYSQALSVDGQGDTRVGVGGAVPMAANQDAVKIEGKTSDGAALDGLALEDDFGGPLYDARPPGVEGTFGIYAHRSGAYTADIRDVNGQRGARRVNPNADDKTVGLDAVETGKAALADYLVRFLVETQAQAAVFEDGTPEGIDDVPTGQDVTDDVVSSAVSKARENAGDNVEDVDRAIENVVDTETTVSRTTTNETLDSTVTASTVTESTSVSAQTATKTERLETETETATETPRGDGTTPTATPTDDKENEQDSDGTETPTDTAEKGFTGILRAIDASLLVAVAAREQARSGNVTAADKRLEGLTARLAGLQRAIERSESLPETFGGFITNRADRMRPRVQAAIDADR